MATGQTFFSNQGTIVQPLSDGDYLVVNQTNNTTGTGYLTGTTTLGLIKSLIFNSFTTDETSRLVNFDTSKLLTGTGTTTNPIQMNTQGLSSNWMANKNSTGVSQLGDMIYTTLGIIITGSQLVIVNRVHVFLDGRPGTLLPQSIDLSTFVPGSTMYVYITRDDTNVVMRISYQTLDETYSTIYVGQIKNQNGTYTISEGFVPTIRIGLTRLSTVPRGGSFYTTQGHPSTKAYLTFGGTGNGQMVKAGVDTSQTTGSVSFDRTNNGIVINGSGQFYITNLEAVTKRLGNTFIVRRYSNNINGSGYLNGQLIWQGYGDNYDTANIGSLLVEGWNTVVFSNGGCTLRCPFLN